MKKRFFLLILILSVLSGNVFAVYWCKSVSMNQTMYSASKEKNAKINLVSCVFYPIENIFKDMLLPDPKAQEKVKQLLEEYLKGKSFSEKITVGNDTWTIRTWDFNGLFQEGDQDLFQGQKKLLMVFNPSGSKATSMILTAFEEFVYARIPTADKNEWLALSLHTRFMENTPDPAALEKKQLVMLNLQMGKGIFTLLMFNKELLEGQLKQYLFEAKKDPAPRQTGILKDIMIAYHPSYDSQANARVKEGVEMIFKINAEGNLDFSIRDPEKDYFFVRHELSPEQVYYWLEALGLDAIKKAVENYHQKTHQE
ncbi:MAG TPA: hypothetical protein DHW82_14315 [Spirochaetia bacterium]|nr:MAG: hypothetical protein A2Y41_12155 [Spirochaetes bacterium GWB1_36_13]HCL58165.1 hypothetical protein [Spirochaetia bacterium]